MKVPPGFELQHQTTSHSEWLQQEKGREAKEHEASFCFSLFTKSVSIAARTAWSWVCESSDVGAVRWAIMWEVRPRGCGEEHGNASALTGQACENSLYEWVNMVGYLWGSRRISHSCDMVSKRQ